MVTYEHKHAGHAYVLKFSFGTNYHLDQGNYFEIDISRSKEQSL